MLATTEEADWEDPKLMKITTLAVADADGSTEDTPRNAESGRHRNPSAAP